MADKVPLYVAPGKEPIEVFCEATIDPVLKRALTGLEGRMELIDEIAPELKKLWRQYKRDADKLRRQHRGKLTDRYRRQERSDLMTLVRVYEKLSRAMAYASDMARTLCTFRAEASRGFAKRVEVDVCLEVTGKGETQLAQEILAAAAGTGKLCPACTRLALNGTAPDAG